MSSLRSLASLALTACLALAAILGCRARGAAAPDPLVVVGPAPYRYPAAPPSNRGTVVVAVRVSDAPERSLAQAAVVLVASDDDRRVASASTGLDGVARLDSVPVGDYSLRVLRVGYKAHTLPVSVRGDCPQRVEVHLELAPTCLFPCPQVRARATVTICAPAT